VRATKQPPPDADDPFGAALHEARTQGRGKTEDQVHEILREALRRHGALLPSYLIAIEARQIARPREMYLHPFRFARWARQIRERCEVEESADEAAFEEEVHRLANSLDRFRGDDFPEILGFSSSHTIDGYVHHVQVDPWTEEVAARIRTHVAPIRVEVVDTLPERNRPHPPGPNIDEVIARDIAETERRVEALGGREVTREDIDAWAATDEAAGEQADAAQARLAAIVAEVGGVERSAIHSWLADDGFEIEVYIAPWSLRSAGRIERAARPLAVTVKPLDP
jgi:hypothetical protein